MLLVYDPYPCPNISDSTVSYGTVRRIIPHEMFFMSIAGIVELPPVITQGLSRDLGYKSAFMSRQAALSQAYVDGMVDEEELLTGHDVIHGWQQWGTIPSVTVLYATNAPLGLTET